MEAILVAGITAKSTARPREGWNTAPDSASAG